MSATGNPDIAKRLRQARKNADVGSAKAAAKSMGIEYSTYIGHENGSRKFDHDAATLYAKRFKVSLDWLLTGRGRKSSIDSRLEELFRIAPDEAEDLRQDFEITISRRLNQAADNKGRPK